MIQLPNNHVASAEVALIDRGGIVSGSLGGDDQRIDRVGAKFAVTFQLRPLTAEQARIFVPRFLRAGREMGFIKFPQPGIVNRIAGAVTVQQPRAANLDSIWLNTNNAADFGRIVLEGQAIQLWNGVHHFIHIVTADTAIQNDLNVLVPIFPPLRRSFVAGNIAVLQDPQMQGYPQPDDQKWSIDLAKTRGLSFTMQEAH